MSYLSRNLIIWYHFCIPQYSRILYLCLKFQYNHYLVITLSHSYTRILSCHIYFIDHIHRIICITSYPDNLKSQGNQHIYHPMLFPDHKLYLILISISVTSIYGTSYLVSMFHIQIPQNRYHIQSRQGTFDMSGFG